ncbi:MAG TPA: hypothetical protein VHX64_08460 [Caulobacteraceae bacterium]|jgi:hypothetical protein|nr:hypothetical protein [Caulobacteraceae bacterium]
MSLSDLAAVGSFVSSAAVVATLALLLLQMRQVDRNQKALLQQGRSARVTELILRRTEPELSKALTKALLGNLSIEDSQVQAVNAFFAALFWSIEDSYLQSRQGLLLASSWETDAATLRGFFTSPACRTAWLMNRDLMDGEYRDHVDALMREIKPVAPADILATWRALMEGDLKAASGATAARGD